MQSQEKANASDIEPEDEAETETGAEAEAAAQPDAPDLAEQDAASEPLPGADESGIAAELADTKDKLLRALAETENIRRRAQRDVDNASKRAFSGFAREIIVVADNLSRALEAVDAKTVEGNDQVKSLVDGVEMTARELQKAFERNGIQKIEPLGEKFDPQVHEAMFEYEDPSMPAGSVGQVMEAGYILGGQPLRPAKVGVTKGGPKEPPKDPEGKAPTPSDQVLDEGQQDKAKSAGGNAYEDHGKRSGSTFDEEL